MFRKVVGALVRPQVETFVFDHALMTEKRELLRGATQAAETVSGALREALGARSSASLEPLLAKKLVDPRLHKALCETVIALAETDCTTAYDVRGSARLEAVRMIVGPDRGACGSAKEPLARVEVGDCLVIVGDAHKNLYAQATQEQLMEQHGATVRCSVAFDGAYDSTDQRDEPQTYVFEAFVPGSRLLDPDFDHDFSFTVADINGVAAGNEFWTEAAPEAQLFSIYEMAKIWTN